MYALVSMYFLTCKYSQRDSGKVLSAPLKIKTEIVSVTLDRIRNILGKASCIENLKAGIDEQRGQSMKDCCIEQVVH